MHHLENDRQLGEVSDGSRISLLMAETSHILHCFADPKKLPGELYAQPGPKRAPAQAGRIVIPLRIC